jgi:hypothetical protein
VTGAGVGYEEVVYSLATLHDHQAVGGETGLLAQNRVAMWCLEHVDVPPLLNVLWLSRTFVAIHSGIAARGWNDYRGDADDGSRRRKLAERQWRLRSCGKHWGQSSMC